MITVLAKPYAALAANALTATAQSAADFGDVFPLVDSLWDKALIVALGFLLTLGLSGWIVEYLVQIPSRERAAPDGGEEPEPKPRFDTHAVIGKCENVIALTFILAGEATGLALIFASKSLVRSQDIHRNPGYYLGGTLVNLVWSVMMGYAIKLTAFGP